MRQGHCIDQSQICPLAELRAGRMRRVAHGEHAPAIGRPHPRIAIGSKREGVKTLDLVDDRCGVWPSRQYSRFERTYAGMPLPLEFIDAQAPEERDMIADERCARHASDG